jgi:calcineurin-like phosphoesterase family protein
MSNVRFIGCLHLGHKWMAIHRGFEDVHKHDENLIDSWNSVVHKRDLTYILGDVTMETDEHYYQLDRLNGRKIVVLGNHDMPKHTKKLLDYVESVAGMVDYKGFILTHCPIHPNEISFCRGNIHAHIHENKLHEVEILDRYGDSPDDIKNTTLYKYYNVDAHLIGYKPKTIEELLQNK